MIMESKGDLPSDEQTIVEPMIRESVSWMREKKADVKRLESVRGCANHTVGPGRRANPRGRIINVQRFVYVLHHPEKTVVVCTVFLHGIKDLLYAGFM